jgi:hypothetical protein
MGLTRQHCDEGLTSMRQDVSKVLQAKPAEQNILDAYLNMGWCERKSADGLAWV